MTSSIIELFKKTIEEDKIKVLPGKSQVLWQHPEHPAHQVKIARRTTSDSLVLISRINGFTKISKPLAKLTRNHGHISSAYTGTWQTLGFETDRNYQAWQEEVKKASFK